MRLRPIITPLWTALTSAYSRVIPHSGGVDTNACSFYARLPQKASMSKLAREWFPPEGALQQAPTSLHLYNSLLDEKVPFVPADGLGSRQITW